MRKICLRNYKAFVLQGFSGGGFSHCEVQLKSCIAVNSEAMLNLITLYSGRRGKDDFNVCSSCTETLKNTLEDLTIIPTLNEKTDLLEQIFPDKKSR